MSLWDSDVALYKDASISASLKRKPQRQSSVDSGNGTEDTSSIASEESYCEYSPVVERRKWQRSEVKSQAFDSLAVAKARHTPIKSVFQELQEIRDDLTQMNDQVTRTTESLRQVKQLRACRPSSGHRQQKSAVASTSGEVRYTPGICISSKRKERPFDEDEMVDVTHRVLKRVCQLSLAKVEGNFDVSLLV